jgi:SAM-dependent methyltransferase
VLDFDAYPEETASFDLVLMMGTVSNLAAPVGHFAKVRRLLKPGGVFYCNLPVADAWPARLYGARYWMYAPSVCNFMTQAGMRAALTRAGFATIEVATDVQRPTFAKLAGHLRLHALYPWLAKLGLAGAQLPFGLPVPGVKVIRARAA